MSSTRAAGARLRTGFRRPTLFAAHGWPVPLLIFAAFRGIDALVMAWASQYQLASSELQNGGSDSYFVHQDLPADPGILGVSTTFDGQWYSLIATDGYGGRPEWQRSHPDAADRTWQFPPGYPIAARVVMALTHTDFPIAAILVSLTAGAVASVLIHRLFLPRVGLLGAAGAVALVNAWVSAPVLGMAHSESLALALLAGILLAMARRRPWLAASLVLPLALTRLITPPLVVVACVCWITWNRQGSLSRSDKGALLCVAAGSSLGLFAWPASQQLWTPGGQESRLAEQPENVFHGSWFGFFQAVMPGAGLLPLFVLGIIARLVWLHRSSLEPVAAAWIVSYSAFLLFAVPAHPGVVRYSLMAFPLAVVLVGRPDQSKMWRMVGVAAGCLIGLALQIVWIRHAVVVHEVGQPFGV